MMHEAKRLEETRASRLGRGAAWSAVCLLGGGLLLSSLSSAVWAQSAKSKLQELKKAREADKPAPAKKGAGASEHSWASPDDVTYIDKMLQEEWKALGFPVSEECSDGEFVRRASLDLIGRIPTVEETRAYLSDRTADKREKLVNRLLASPEYGKNWGIVWAKLLTPIGPDDREDGANKNINPDAMADWLEKNFNRNASWQEMVKEIIGGTGRWDENGATNFMIAKLKNGTTAEATAFTTKIFLSVQTQCTECHDHPWNEWKQDQFHGLNAFFKGTRERQVRTTLPSGMVATDYIELTEAPTSDLPEVGTFFERRNGLTVMVPPTFLDGRDLNALLKGVKSPMSENGSQAATDPLSDDSLRYLFEDDASKNGSGEPIYLRKILAKVITDDDNPYFARATVNRLWYHYFGHSFIKNVDDFDNGQDEPSMPDLLDRLAEDFKAHGYDMKRLHRWICSSKAYALSTKQRGKDNEEAIGFFTFQLVKPLTPEQLYDSVITLTQIDKTSKSANASEERRIFLREFKRTFGASEEATSTPKYDGTITQALMMMNSPLMNRACSCEPGSFLHTLATDTKLKPEEKVEAIFLAALSRNPTSAERKELVRVFQGSKIEDALSDVLWAVLNSAEFVLNH